MPLPGKVHVAALLNQQDDPQKDCFEASCAPLPGMHSQLVHLNFLADQPAECFLASCTPLPSKPFPYDKSN